MNPGAAPSAEVVSSFHPDSAVEELDLSDFRVRVDGGFPVRVLSTGSEIVTEIQEIS
jgi:hypothetical protein